MAGPAQQQTLKLVVPPGEAQVQYSAASLAWRVENLALTSEGTLRSVVGPAVYEPDRFEKFQGIGAITDDPHGIFQTTLLGGQSNTLIVRVGQRLYRHTGWLRTTGITPWEALTLTGVKAFSSEGRPKFPDQFVVLNDKIIWTNGVDQAMVISSDGMTVPLGYAERPGPLDVAGPSSQRTSSQNLNTGGYSWVGRIGTVGDVYNGEEGAVLAGAWYYHARLEDIHGNLSAPSPVSNVASISTIRASPFNANKIGNRGQFGFRGVVNNLPEIVANCVLDDLTRQFAVSFGGDVPEHTVAVHLYRTPDTRNASTVPRFLTRVPNYREFTYPDNYSDSDLGPEMVSSVPVPIFRVMCTHQGSLIIGNTTGAPGIVRRSEPGFPGTFPELDFVYPDAGGAAVTGLVSHRGWLLAFTETSTYSLENFAAPVPLAQGIGCTAPRSIAAMASGMLIWLGRDGFYGLTPDGSIQLISGAIDRTIRNYINKSRACLAVAAIDATSGEYRCALSPAGDSENSLVLCFDGRYWRRMDLGMHIADMCTTDDWRQYTMFLGYEQGYQTTELPMLGSASGVDISGTTGTTTVRTKNANHVYVMDKETTAFTPPDRTIVYRSGWMRADDVGLTPMNVRSMFVGMIDSWNGDFTVRFYRNGSWSEFVSMTDVKAVGVDDGSRVVMDVAGAAIIGQAKTHDPRLFWRQVPVGIENANTWAFEIEAKSPTRLHIASFAFDVSVATLGNVKARIPHRADE